MLSYLLRLAHDRQRAELLMLEPPSSGIKDVLSGDGGQMKLAIGHVDLGRDHRERRRCTRWLFLHVS